MIFFKGSFIIAINIPANSPKIKPTARIILLLKPSEFSELLLISIIVILFFPESSKSSFALSLIFFSY